MATLESGPIADIERELARPAGWLRFATPSLESAFRTNYARGGTLGRWFVFMVPLVLFCLTPLYAAPVLGLPRELPREGTILMFGVIVPACALAVLPLAFRALERFADAAALAGAIVMPLGIVTLSVLAPGEGLYVPPYLGVINLASLYVLARLPFGQLFVAATVAFGCALALQLQAWGHGPQARFELFAQCLLMTLGAVAGYLFELASRRSWLRMKLLGLLAHADPLTGLSNRRAFEQAAETLLRQAARERKGVVCMLVDIDAFKKLNDRDGHARGDECLVRVAAALADCTRRPFDLCARLGGEEFALVWYDAAPEAMPALCDGVIASVRALGLAHAASPVAPVVTISGGAVALVPDADTSLGSLLRNADALLYQAKSGGRNRAVFVEVNTDG